MINNGIIHIDELSSNETCISLNLIQYKLIFKIDTEFFETLFIQYIICYS